MVKQDYYNIYITLPRRGMDKNSNFSAVEMKRFFN